MIVVVAVRRYLCVACRALITVVPRGLSRWRHYSAAAIGVALALYGLMRETEAAVRDQVNPWRIVSAAANRWASLRRWTAAARHGALFPRLSALSGTARQVAEQAATTLAAYAPPTSRHLSPSVQAFLGSAAVA